MRIGLSFGFGPLRFYQSLFRSRARYWRHGGCSVRHRSPGAAERCRRR